MKKKNSIDDLELYVDPTPLTQHEKIGLSDFIKKLKEKNKKNSVIKKRSITKRVKAHL